MEYTRLGDTRLRPSALGFGCAAVGSRYSRRESLRALSIAFDLGVNYWDVARAYGYGEAESIVGAFIRDKRDRVIVATKFGLDPPTLTPAHRVLKALARRAFRIAPGLRRAARQQLGKQFARRRFDADAMSRSLDESLRQLRTDYVDVFLVHDCTFDALADDRLFDALDRARASGKVRFVGASGERRIVEEALRRRPALTVAQFQHDLFAQPIGGALQRADCTSIGFQPFGGGAGLGRLLEVVRRARDLPSTPEELRRKLRAAREDQVVATLALSGARLDGVAVVLATMFGRAHIEANVHAITRAILTADDLRYLREIGRHPR